MRIFISEYDRYNAFRVALLVTANFHDIPYYEYKSNLELIEALKIYKSPLLSYLEKYFVNYDNWFNFYQERKKNEEQEDRDYDLNNYEKETLRDLSDKREKSLQELQEAFNELRRNKD